MRRLSQSRIDESPDRLCFWIITPPAARKTSWRSRRNRIRRAPRRHSCKKQSRQLKAYQGEPPGAVGGIGDRLLKQLLVVFTPYPGFKAVRKAHSSLKSDQSEQPFFLSSPDRGGLGPAVIFHLFHPASHLQQPILFAQLFGHWEELVLLFVNVTLDAFAQV